MSLKEKLTCRYPALFLFISLLAIKAVSQLPQAQMDSLARELTQLAISLNDSVQNISVLSNCYKVLGKLDRVAGRDICTSCKVNRNPYGMR